MRYKYLEIHENRQIKSRKDITGRDTDAEFDKIQPDLTPGQEVLEYITIEKKECF